MAAAADHEVATALRGMATLLVEAADTVLEANAADVEAAESAGTTSALVDRLRLDRARLEGMAQSLVDLADIPTPAIDTVLEERPDGLRLIERRRPVGVIGANFEARPNVVVDVASQLLKSRNAGVLRTGGAALASATALMEAVVAPALAGAGLDPDSVVLVTDPRRECAVELVRRPGLIPLVILRGSGDTTRSLGLEAAQHGVRTLAHADGGGVLYVDRAAPVELAHTLVTSSVDRLGVCNRLNLLLVDRHRWDELVPGLVALLDGHGLRASLPPHEHALGHEWALDDGNEATVTLAPVDGPADAATTANRETSGLAADDRHLRRGLGAGVPRHLRRHRRVLERHHPPARRRQAAPRPRDRHQRRPRPGPPRPGGLHRPLPAPVRGRARLHGDRAPRVAPRVRRDGAGARVEAQVAALEVLAHTAGDRELVGLRVAQARTLGAQLGPAR